ncbi:hypothetical protein CKM354_000611300 [Cercospora kikuchii]|uniref:HpcH/HpaI aldolase/citrate lyase domain-containing protein n=1 Tax=Cercospora kikuchii TaxID=84275 RepID=A0A9P3CK48_9PEZI|nr:uncharacterized protein CKM354_000611300 [Cercospora kikuchii]GIZ42862.1 hypothetical protein CKM354_000611300 [Cercospora kikuchii]
MLKWRANNESWLRDSYCDALPSQQPRFSSELSWLQALGVKMFGQISVVQVAKDAGYDSLFLDLEHSAFTLDTAWQLCRVANMAGISPFARVPGETGNGYIQRVLDGDARGVIFPHSHTADDATAAVKMTKYPPLGIRSINPSLLEADDGTALPADEAARMLASQDAVCFIQIETEDALRNVDSIAAVPGVDVLMIGSMDLTIELGILANWEHPLYQKALRDVSAAASRHGKQWGISGLFGRPDLWRYATTELGARFIVGALDFGLFARAASANAKMLRSAVKPARDEASPASSQ